MQNPNFLRPGVAKKRLRADSAVVRLQFYPWVTGYGMKTAMVGEIDSAVAGTASVLGRDRVGVVQISPKQCTIF